MEKGTIIYVRKCLHMSESVFLISQKTKQERFIILSDNAKISRLGYWTRNFSREESNNILIYDRNKSVIGEEYKYPRAGNQIYKMYLTQLHRKILKT